MSFSALVLSRVFTTVIFMTYPACLPTLIEAWGMSKAEAGLVQTGFLAAFTISLLCNSWAADHFGAKRVFLVYAWLGTVAALCFALFARSFESALLLVTIGGAAQGGANTPSIMLVAQNLPKERQGVGFGWLLAGMSAGYAFSIALAIGVNMTFGYEAAFLASASCTALGVLFGVAATWRVENTIAQSAETTDVRFSMTRDRPAILLSVGYFGHSWELIGVWSWLPAFLTIKLVKMPVLFGLDLGGVGLGIAIAFVLHISGLMSSVLMGKASDVLGKRRVLIYTAAVGALFSFLFGWVGALAPGVILLLAALYGFSITGDAAVLTAAMTETVPPEWLGRALGIRTAFGLGLAALAPLLFGSILDWFPDGDGWGWAFMLLGVGGVIATISAIALPKPAYNEGDG